MLSVIYRQNLFISLPLYFFPYFFFFACYLLFISLTLSFLFPPAIVVDDTRPQVRIFYSCILKKLVIFAKRNNPSFTDRSFHIIIIIIIIIIKRGRQEVVSARLGLCDLHLISPKTPAPQYQPIDRKKSKGK